MLLFLAPILSALVGSVLKDAAFGGAEALGSRAASLGANMGAKGLGQQVAGVGAEAGASAASPAAPVLSQVRHIVQTQVQPVIQTRVQPVVQGAAPMIGGYSQPSSQLAAPPVQQLIAASQPPPQAAMPHYMRPQSGPTSSLPPSAPSNVGADQASQSAGQKEAIGEAGSAAASLGAAAAIGANPVGLAVAALAVLPPACFKFSEALVEGNKALAKYNGQIGQSYAKLDQQRITRSMQSGAATADSTSELVDATNQMEQELRPLKDITTNIMNKLGVWAAQFATAIIDIAKEVPGIGGTVKKIEEDLKKEHSAGVWTDFMKDVAKDGRNRRPKMPVQKPLK